MKQGNSISSSMFKLDDLEKKDILLCCSPFLANKQFWLSAATDASVLHTELNAPVYDWKISINSPLKLENRLPCPAEFTIWERTKEGKGVEVQQGVILSRKSAHIYAADPRKAMYLSFFVQGGWSLEKVQVPQSIGFHIVVPLCYSFDKLFSSTGPCRHLGSFL